MYDKKEDIENAIYGYCSLEQLNNNFSMGTGRNETGVDSNQNKHNFEKIEEIKILHFQTEKNKSNQKTIEKNKFKHKNSLDSSKDSKILQKKKLREEKEKTKKSKKTKSEMDYTLKNKTEINEENKKKNEKNVYTQFNQDNFNNYIDVYEDQKGSGDFFDTMNEDLNKENLPEVNKTKPIYKTEINNEIPEAFKMIISSELNN